MAILAALLAALSPPAPAANVAILEPTNNSCGSWLAYRRAGNPTLGQIEQWIAGYASGIAIMQSSTDYLRGLDPEAVFGWLDDHCGANPLEPLSDAVMDLAHERGGAAPMSLGKSPADLPDFDQPAMVVGDPVRTRRGGEGCLMRAPAEGASLRTAAAWVG
jgi:hypothetical protein